MEKIYVVGHSKTNLDNPITKIYNKFFLAFIISRKDDAILDVEAPFILKITNVFVKELFVGRNFVKDEDKILEDIRSSYIGDSQRSVIVAYKDALKKYIKLRN
ncbi:MAG: DUF3870 domain-containing protein [Fusobacteriaceae bacterium]|jgi:hypothetical protein|nr:DUF3870 domain-containing protein [Fusobacteriaceae bacterium]